jgi:hypothetical protein
MMNAVQTITLNSGHKVLAKTKADRNGYRPAVHYTNKTQANKKAAELQALGVACKVFQPRLGPVRYILIEG